MTVSPLRFIRQVGYRKIVKGGTYYFGSVANGWQATLELWESERDTIYLTGAPAEDELLSIVVDEDCCQAAISWGLTPSVN